jgi:hypothetical protein
MLVPARPETAATQPYVFQRHILRLYQTTVNLSLQPHSSVHASDHSALQSDSFTASAGATAAGSCNSYIPAAQGREQGSGAADLLEFSLASLL